MLVEKLFEREEKGEARSRGEKGGLVTAPTHQDLVCGVIAQLTGAFGGRCESPKAI